MSAQTKQRANIWDVLKSIFSSEIDDDYSYDKVELSPELEAALKSIESREFYVGTGIAATTKSGRKKDFAKPIINPEIEMAMRDKAKGIFRENPKKTTNREIVKNPVDREIAD